MDVVRTIDELGGIATRAQLMSRGFSGGDLTMGVRLGVIWRVRRAHYAVSGVSPAAIAATRVGGRLAGLSAARSYGLWAGFDDRVHVALERNASRLRTQQPPSASEFVAVDFSRQEVVLHWLSDIAPNDECWRVSLRDCLLQVVAWSDAETAIACLDTARSVFGVTDDDLAAIFSSGSAEARQRAGASRPGSQSGVESVVRQRLLRRGISVDQQVTIAGVGRVDMVLSGTRVVVEVDSHEYHTSSDQFENDRRRGAELAVLNYQEIRLTYQRIFGDWAWCERIVMAMLRAADTALASGFAPSASPNSGV